MRRRESARVALKIASGQLRLLRWWMRHQAQDGPPRFIQGWAVGRGYSGVTQCLDSSGQVWERVCVVESQAVEGSKKKIKVVKDSWWEKVSMTRKEDT